MLLQEVCHARSEQDPRHDHPPPAGLRTREGREGGFYQWRGQLQEEEQGYGGKQEQEKLDDYENAEEEWGKIIKL